MWKHLRETGLFGHKMRACHFHQIDVGGRKMFSVAKRSKIEKIPESQLIEQQQQQQQQQN